MPMYDPVRGLTRQRGVESHSSSPPAASIVHSPPRSGPRPSPSPISSIIEPIPAPPQPTPSPLRSFVSNSETTAHSPPSEISQRAPSAPSAPSAQAASTPAAMDLDISSTDLPNGRPVPAAKKGASEAPARALSPRPVRAKEPPLPLPTGSGLLSASLFAGESALDSNENKATGPNIVLHIDLKDPKNKVINFARMAEKKYGFAALYPRQAAQKERLARVAAAGAALERSASASKHGGTSAGDSGEDDVSVDIDRDSDNDGDVPMGGFSGNNEPANSGTDGPEPKRRRRRKVEEYDQDDPFIDDSEQLWETQAAASKDGFFVYSGPLVPEGEKATVERADGTVRRGRGRGRGGGPGSRGGRGSRAAATATPATDADTTPAAARPATGPGSRGGNAARKPRAKKAERQQPQQEKDKEKEGEKQENGDSQAAPTARPAASTQARVAPLLHLTNPYPPATAQPV